MSLKADCSLAVHLGKDVYRKHKIAQGDSSGSVLPETQERVENDDSSSQEDTKCVRCDRFWSEAPIDVKFFGAQSFVKSMIDK